MRNSDEMANFIKKNINTDHYKLVFMFGSIVKVDSKPNDCDLFIVTEAEPQTFEWSLQRTELKKLSNRFEKKFHLPLSFQFLNIKEFKHPIRVKQRILKREKLVLVNSLSRRYKINY